MTQAGYPHCVPAGCSYAREVSPLYDYTPTPPRPTDLGDLMEAQWLLVEVGQLHAGLAQRHGRAAAGSLPVLLLTPRAAGATAAFRVVGRLALAA